MAHQSGIGVSVELQSFLSDCKDSHIRSFKIVIHDEKMELAGKTEVKQTFQHDYDYAVSQFLEQKSPCYVMVRYDTKNSQNLYNWLFIAYCPDIAIVRDKMTYASTRTSFKRIFGRDLIIDEIYGTIIKDVLFQGYLDHIKSKNAPAPLTDNEKVVEELKETERSYAAVDSTDAGLPSVSLPFDAAVYSAFEDFKNDKINCLQLYIDMNEERVKLGHSENINLSQIQEITPEQEPRFYFFNFNHIFNETITNSKVFLYYTPGFKSPVKQRMIYSTFKATLIKSYESIYGLLDKKIELCDISEFSEEFLMSELHPVKAEVKQLFNKPKKPGRS